MPAGAESYVLDASAILAWLHGETGSEIVESSLGSSVICSVNWAEVLQKIIARGTREPEEVGEDLQYVGLAVVPFSAADAERAARLWSTSRSAGLSLGDRACLSLAMRLELPALTADRRWATLDLAAEVRLIR
ncbi:MAG: type II toxin-antitoxin system VapC family toxin [Chloroflexi bacterium]|nr:type II toxin-antitoxin system VapC family toxin [Chloroflexota bacterium]